MLTQPKLDFGVFDATTGRWLTRAARDHVPWSGWYVVDEDGIHRFSPADAFHRMVVFDERDAFAAMWRALGGRRNLSTSRRSVRR